MFSFIYKYIFVHFLFPAFDLSNSQRKKKKEDRMMVPPLGKPELCGGETHVGLASFESYVYGPEPNGLPLLML